MLVALKIKFWSMELVRLAKINGNMFVEASAPINARKVTNPSGTITREYV